MKTYELLSIIKPNIDMDEYDKLVSKIDEQIAQFGGKVLSADKTGRKKLAYSIKDFRDGYFTVHQFEMEQNQMSKFNRQLRLNENLLRIVISSAAPAGAQQR